MNRAPLEVTAAMVAKGVLATASMGDDGSQEMIDASTVVSILVAAHDLQLTVSESAQLSVDADQLLS